MAKQATVSRKSEKPESTDSPQFPKMKWANIYLNQQQRESAKLLDQKDGSFDSMMATLLGDGYKMSHSFNEETQSTICVIIGARVDGPNHGWAMTTHGGDWYTATLRALYKHFILGAEMTYEEMSQAYTAPQT